MILQHDIVLDDTAFDTASTELLALKSRAETLKKELEDMYKDLSSALDTPVGKKVEMTADKVLLKPIEDLLAVISHISKTLTEIIGTKYYKDIFIKFNELNESLKF